MKAQLSIKIRNAERSDAQSIANLMLGLGFDPAAAEIERRWNLIDDHSKVSTLLAIDENRPVGVITTHITPLLFYPKPLARITTLVVDQTSRRQGIGRALIERAVDFAKKHDWETIELTTVLERTEAHAFYRSIGFQNSALQMSCDL